MSKTNLTHPAGCRCTMCRYEADLADQQHRDVASRANGDWWCTGCEKAVPSSEVELVHHDHVRCGKPCLPPPIPSRPVGPQNQPVEKPRMFPIVGNLPIPWSVAEVAYRAYAKKYGTSQSMERLAERGGFWVDEMDDLHPTWREEVKELRLLRKLLAERTEDADLFRRQWKKQERTADAMTAANVELQVQLNTIAKLLHLERDPEPDAPYFLPADPGPIECETIVDAVREYVALNNRVDKKQREDLERKEEQVEKLQEYVALLESGMSAHEARAMVWGTET